MKFRVGVLTVVEVDVATDAWADAVRVAEGTLSHLIGQENVADPGERPVVRWRHRNGATHDVLIARRPIELGVAMRNGYFYAEVHQPATEED